MILTHESFSREELDALEKRWKKIIKKGAKIERYTLPVKKPLTYGRKVRTV